MIASVRGRVAAVRLDSVVVEVGGVGLLVQATPGTLAELRPGQEAELATSMVVREDSLTLFGFAEADERDVFEIVQTVSGIGPRLALAMLAVLTPEALRLAVAQEDLTSLTKVPGIGRKGAQRIVLELTGKLGAPSGGATAAPVTAVAAPAWRDQVLDALTGLGWPVKAASDAVDRVTSGPDAAVPVDENGATPDMAQVLRAALRQLGRTG
ncbi:Holliday junction branch migration protein RuvA [Kineosporia succinea]|uniref:Holliday junction branch migration complex subunit RuvA n=1 Tax=Kineosporia succinea TaxID=84632 RepID=A0ABT9NWF0_9ACTN|nr:Holliday junction branch migration protein RuvA [Kineosporia succinea]MDP9824340.1 Holliday junction DNA helicase RuvA [Kineosporia succinea]